MLIKYSCAEKGHPHANQILLCRARSFNLTQAITVNLYYAGITTLASVQQEGGDAAPYTLARDYSIVLNVTLPPQGVTWFAISNAG